MWKIQTLNITQVQNYRLNDSSESALISICNTVPPQYHTQVPTGLYDKWIQVFFDDVSDESIAEAHNLTLATEKQAKDIVDFIDNLDSNVSEIVVHCQSGISRSAAVSLFIDEIYNGNKHSTVPRKWEYFNMRVYKLLFNEYMKRFDKETTY